MTVMRRHTGRVLAVAAVLALGAGCAKAPTSLGVTIDADPTVPPILNMRTTIARASDPTMRSSSERASPYASDAADRPGPFVFPFAWKLTVDEGFAGPVVVSIEGLDWDTGATIAGGSADAVVEAQQMTAAAVTLEPVRGGAGDGGTDSAASD